MFHKLSFSATLLGLCFSFLLAVTAPALAAGSSGNTNGINYVPKDGNPHPVMATGLTPSCEQVTDNCTADIMVPTGSQTEWSSFLNNHEQCAVISACPAATCGSAAAVAVVNQPSSNLCGLGSTLSGTVTQSGSNWAWICQNTIDSTTSNCTAPVALAPQCGSGVQTDGNGNITSGTACTSGIASSVDGSGNYTCSNGGVTQACQATIANACVPGP